MNANRTLFKIIPDTGQLNANMALCNRYRPMNAKRPLLLKQVVFVCGKKAANITVQSAFSNIHTCFQHTSVVYMELKNVRNKSKGEGDPDLSLYLYSIISIGFNDTI